jgi:hypothetical protein
MFNPEGKKFLQSLQESTNTYIWWNWSSSFLRIFGNDESSNTAYRKIDEFIQDKLFNRKYMINVPIRQGIEFTLISFLKISTYFSISTRMFKKKQ